MVREFASNSKVKGSNLMGGVVCGQQCYCRNPTFVATLLWPSVGVKPNTWKK
jgi:hypothetical protein